MDTFSTMIIEAVDKTKNAVVKIDVFKTEKGKLRAAGSPDFRTGTPKSKVK
jgi:hypothetical protein